MAKQEEIIKRKQGNQANQANQAKQSNQSSPISLKKKKSFQLKKSPEIKKTPPAVPISENKEQSLGEIDSYNFLSNNMPITVRIYKKKSEFVPVYSVSISSISPQTAIVLEKIREELISAVNLGITDIAADKKTGEVETSFMETIEILIKKYFPDVDSKQTEVLIAYLIMKSLGMGQVEILKDDDKLEEIAINSSEEPIWVFHIKHGWLKTDITLENEEQIRHYASMIGRRIGRQITVLEPLLDAHLAEGDRANATLMPISTKGNTITLRKFARDPFTITHFLRFKTMSISAASLIWLAMQYELSALIGGGTSTGKTATLNVLATFIQPSQRIISIEDTRELRLPKFLHWVPMSTRLPNPEGKGAITMEDLLVNSLRMRPDRIIVGEVRRQREAETLFEAIHTGHSCYATFHSNTADETIRRLTNPPINVPVTMLPAISMIIMQYRNRRTGIRRTFQLAEITPESKANVILQYDAKKDILCSANRSKSLFDTLQLFTGYSPKETKASLSEKEKILKYLVKKNIDHVDDVGKVMAEYYTDKERLMKFVGQNKLLE